MSVPFLIYHRAKPLSTTQVENVRREMEQSHWATFARGHGVQVSAAAAPSWRPTGAEAVNLDLPLQKMAYHSPLFIDAHRCVAHLRSSICSFTSLM